MSRAAPTRSTSGRGHARSSRIDRFEAGGARSRSGRRGAIAGRPRPGGRRPRRRATRAPARAPRSFRPRRPRGPPPAGSRNIHCTREGSTRGRVPVAPTGAGRIGVDHLPPMPARLRPGTDGDRPMERDLRDSKPCREHRPEGASARRPGGDRVDSRGVRWTSATRQPRTTSDTEASVDREGCSVGRSTGTGSIKAGNGGDSGDGGSRNGRRSTGSRFSPRRIAFWTA